MREEDGAIEDKGIVDLLCRLTCASASEFVGGITIDCMVVRHCEHKGGLSEASPPFSHRSDVVGTLALCPPYTAFEFQRAKPQ